MWGRKTRVDHTCFCWIRTWEDDACSVREEDWVGRSTCARWGKKTGENPMCYLGEEDHVC